MEKAKTLADSLRPALSFAPGSEQRAVTSQNWALLMAGRLNWDLAPLNERLARYSASQPWYGTLLDF